MKSALLFLLLVGGLARPVSAQQAQLPTQGLVFSFFEYGIKDGHESAFANGYHRDLEWHQANQDNWTWLGWFVTNGPRRGRFIDATPNHQWQDFDNWGINRAENAKHNDIHFIPHTEKASGQYRIVLPEYSSLKDDWYQAPLLHTYYFELNPGQEKVFGECMGSFKKAFLKAYPARPLVWMKTVSGDNLPQFVLFVPMSKQADLQMSETLLEPLITSTLPIKEANEVLQSLSRSVKNSWSELWSYRPDLSLYPSKK